MSDQKQRNWFARHKVLTVILAFVVIGIIGGAAGGGSKTEPKKDTAQTAQEKPKLSLQETFDKIQSGAAKTEVEAIIGKDSGVCSVTEDQMVGKMESCTYGGGIFESGMLIITYQNDKVYNKTIASR